MSRPNSGFNAAMSHSAKDGAVENIIKNAINVSVLFLTGCVAGLLFSAGVTEVLNPDSAAMVTLLKYLTF